MKDSLPRSTPVPHLPALHNLNAVAPILAVTVLACLAIATAPGVLAAVYLRRRRLAWTWGLLALLPWRCWRL